MSLDRGLWVFRSIYDNPKIAYRSGHLMMEISLRNEEMNDHLSLLQGYAAKRKLAELFQSEGFVQENQPPIAIVGHEFVPAVQTGIKQTRKSLRESRCRHLRMDRATSSLGSPVIIVQVRSHSPDWGSCFWMEPANQAIRQAKFQNSAFAIVVSANKFIATIRNAEKCRCYKRRNQFDRAKVDRS